VRLDYNYPPAPGDIDHPASFAYDVFYKVVPGLTFEMCQSGKLTPEVEERFLNTIKYFEAKGVSGITGDCGFMMYFQALARQATNKPVFMSALAQLPAVTAAFGNEELIAIFTANGSTLKPMEPMICDECGVNVEEQRYVIVGCEDVPHFEAVARGEKVDVDKVTPGMIAKARDVLATYPNIRAILLECTELPPYADALRKETGLPVYDAITACDFFMMGVQDNERFGLQDWQVVWDGQQEEYTFAQNLTEEEKAALVNVPKEERAGWLSSIGKTYASMSHVASTAKTMTEYVTSQALNATKAKEAPVRAKDGTLGIVRLDYNYPPAPGDIDHPASFAYDVFYKVVPGLTFEMCQSGKLTPEVEERFLNTIKYFEAKGVSGITGDCGFMMYFQALARQATNKPVFMSALAQLPAVTAAFGNEELIAIFTANGSTLKPMEPMICDECGVNVEEQRYVIVGCEDVPHFEAVARGEKVDVDKVTPGMIAKARDVLATYPNIRAILLECTELPPYADALRKETGLPVYDAITACDFFMMGVQDNERFGLQDWQVVWDGQQEEYTFAQNLTEEEKKHLVNKVS